MLSVSKAIILSVSNAYVFLSANVILFTCQQDHNVCMSARPYCLSIIKVILSTCLCVCMCVSLSLSQVYSDCLSACSFCLSVSKAVLFVCYQHLFFSKTTLIIYCQCVSVVLNLFLSVRHT